MVVFIVFSLLLLPAFESHFLPPACTIYFTFFLHKFPSTPSAGFLLFLLNFAEETFTQCVLLEVFVPYNWQSFFGFGSFCLNYCRFKRIYVCEVDCSV